MIDKKIIFTILPALAVLGLLVSFFSDPNATKSKPNEHANKSEQIKVTQKKTDSIDRISEAETDSQAHLQKHKNKNSRLLKKYPKGFDYKKAAAKLENLKKHYPETEDQLLAMVLDANEYAHVEPHSAAELAQRQTGALKVEALKALVILSKDPDVLDLKLKQVAQNSKDPVMRRIAKASLDAKSKGRSFFDDTVKALGDLPIPE